MANICLSVDKDFYDKHVKEATDRNVEDGGDELNAVFNINAVVTDWEITDEESLYVSFDTDMGYISVEFPLTSDMLERIINLSVKKLNKLKTLLETVK